jgi:hypothetical protein
MPDFRSWRLTELILVSWFTEVLGTAFWDGEPEQRQDRRGKDGIQFVYSCDVAPNLVIFVMYVSLCKSCSDVPFSIQKKVVI